MEKRANKIIIAFVLFVIALIVQFELSWINNFIFILSYIIVGSKIVLKAVSI